MNGDFGESRGASARGQRQSDCLQVGMTRQPQAAARDSRAGARENVCSAEVSHTALPLEAKLCAAGHRPLASPGPAPGHCPGQFLKRHASRLSPPHAAEAKRDQWPRRLPVAASRHPAQHRGLNCPETRGDCGSQRQSGRLSGPGPRCLLNLKKAHPPPSLLTPGAPASDPPEMDCSHPQVSLGEKSPAVWKEPQVRGARETQGTCGARSRLQGEERDLRAL